MRPTGRRRRSETLQTGDGEQWLVEWHEPTFGPWPYHVTQIRPGGERVYLGVSPSLLGLRQKAGDLRDRRKCQRSGSQL